MICVDLCVALVASSGISGYIIDATGNFDLPYYLFGLCGIVGSALMYVVAVIQWKSKHAPDKVNKLPTDRNAVIFSNASKRFEDDKCTASVVSLARAVE